MSERFRSAALQIRRDLAATFPAQWRGAPHATAAMIRRGAAACANLERSPMNHRHVALLLAAWRRRSARPDRRLSTSISSSRKRPVSPTLYGLMTEEINYSYDGGLYAELVRNRTFRSDWSGILNWFLIEKGRPRPRCRSITRKGRRRRSRTARSSRSRRPTPTARPVCSTKATGELPCGRTPGTPARSTRRPRDGALPVSVALVADQSGQVLATPPLRCRAGWKQYKFEMQSGSVAASSENHLELTIDQPATLWLQLVSLFPPTYHDRPNGNRVDIMEKLAAMQSHVPALPRRQLPGRQPHRDPLRLEEDDRPAGRPSTHPTTWSYHSTDGMGLLEFLEWCEDLTCSRCSAVYAGYSLGGQVVKPGPDLEPYVQDALEEIEYVTGGAGHQVGRGARARRPSRAVHAALRRDRQRRQLRPRSTPTTAATPSSTRRSRRSTPTSRLSPPCRSRASRPTWSTTTTTSASRACSRRRSTTTRPIATAPRSSSASGPRAKARRLPTSARRSGDAAFLTGLERNSDVVIMSAYAPLFVNVNPGGMQWSYRPDRL